jgi:hypothetical protein
MQMEGQTLDFPLMRSTEQPSTIDVIVAELRYTLSDEFKFSHRLNIRRSN